MTRKKRRIKSSMRGAKKTREKKKREYWEKKKKKKKKEEYKSRVLYVCVCVVVVALNRLGEKLQDFFQRGDERVHVLFGVVDVETGAAAKTSKCLCSSCVQWWPLRQPTPWSWSSKVQMSEQLTPSTLNAAKEARSKFLPVLGLVFSGFGPYIRMLGMLSASSE